MNVDDLLQESDSDDSEDNDQLLQGDPDLEKFRKKAGLTNSVLNAAVGGIGGGSSSSAYSSTLNKIGLQSMGNSGGASTASSILGSGADSRAKQISLMSSISGGGQIDSNQRLLQANAKPKLSKEEQIKAALDLKLSSDSNDSDEELEKLLAQTAASKTKKANAASSQSVQNKASNLSSTGDSIKDLTKDFILSSNQGLTLNQQLQNIAQMDILEIIEKNERLNEQNPEKEAENNESQILQVDKRHYNVQKKLFTYHEFKDIAKRLHHTKNHEFSGMVSALTVIQDFIFVGNSSGIIRVFDMKTQKEMKPLKEESVIGSNNKVTSLDISEDGGFLISGYKKGQIALWDLVGYKLIKFMSDLHSSEVINAKVYHIDENENVCALSCEDAGRVQLIRFNKKILGGYSSEAQFLFKTRLKGTATLSLHKKNQLYPHKYCDNSSLVAFGSLNEIVVCQMRPTIKEIFQINRPSFCKEKSIPYIDWGYGLTPSHRERTVPIMAFAWDRLIQLVYINETTQTVEMDGFYYSDQEINSLFFIGDSILFVLVNGREVKVLYTTKFHQGHFKFLESAKKDDLLNNPFEKVIGMTSHCELEKGFEQPDIKSSLLQCQMVMNFNQSVRRHKLSLFFLCGKTLVRAKLFSWREYLDHLKFQENADWLQVLKVAIEIYFGELKGFGKVPDEKEIREGILKGFMKDMIKEGVQQYIYKIQTNRNPKQGDDRSAYQVSTGTQKADSIATKVAIEFCLSINSTFFLFTEIFALFQDNKLEKQFIASLEPFLLSGQLKKEHIPSDIIQKIIAYYEDRRDYKGLERVLQQIDFSDYPNKIDLIVTCEQNCLISALLYLMSSQSSEETQGCMQILNNMLKLMTTAKNISVSKEDIFLVQKFESSRKYEIEKSRPYIGYKLLWILKLFIEGKSYPTGYLTQEKHRIHVYDIATFITNDYVLDELLQFDCEQFFRVVTKLYSKTVAYKFLEEQRDYLTNNPVKGVGLSASPTKVINQMFLAKCKGNEVRLQHYYKFLIAVQAQHEYHRPESDPFLFVDKDLLLEAIIKTLQKSSASKDTIDLDSTDLLSNLGSGSAMGASGGIYSPLEEEQLLIKAIQNKKYKDEAVDKMLSVLELQIRMHPQLRIFLVERKKDFVQSFRLNMASTALKKNIFEWINKTLSKLASEGGTTLDPSHQFHQLKQAVSKRVRDLIQLSDSECVALIDRWFEDSYQEQLILEELAEHPEIQFNYVRRLINQNEERIKTAIAEATYSSQKKPEAERYMQYLILHTRLLCKFERERVQDYVKKEYYPVTECLEICKEEKVPRAVAELLKRNGNFLQSLKAYLEIVEKELNKADMMEEIYQNSKHLKPTNNATSTAKLLSKSGGAQASAYHFEFLNCQKMPTIHDFDCLLEKAIKIAEKQQTIVGEEGWFTILEFLSDLRNRLQKDLFPSTLPSSTLADSQQQQQVSQILKTKDKQKLDLLKEFVFQRKNFVLRLVPTSISLQTLTQRLNLDFKQIKELYDFKVKAVRNNEKYLKIALSMHSKELIQISDDTHNEMNRGMFIIDEAKCDQCTMTLQLAVQRVPLKVFKCDHNYHSNCLKEDKCVKCIKQTLEIEGKDTSQKKRGRKESSSTADSNDSSSTEKEKSLQQMQAQAELAFMSSSSEKSSYQQQLGNQLLIKRMEVFDTALETQGLTRASFLGV